MIQHLWDRIHIRYRRGGIKGIVGAAVRLALRRLGLFPLLVWVRRWRDCYNHDLVALREPFKIVSVDPEQIEYYLFPGYKDRYRWYGRVVSED